MKKILLSFMVCLTAMGVSAMERTVKIEIRNIAVSLGKVYIAIYNSEKAYKNNEPYKSYIVDSNESTIKMTEKLQEGDYLISVFQDKNNNKKLDINILGIPKEPVGISNYSGKGIPGGFDKLKTKVSDENQVLIVNMFKL